MSINDELEQDPSITEINRAIELFTDRMQERRLFASYLNDPACKSILFFHGDGGNGKSWLLRMLQERYCRYLPADSWNFVKTQASDEDFAFNFENAAEATAVPCAYLDFGKDKDKRNVQPRLAFDGLVKLREQLGRQGFRFPLFDYAMAVYQIRGRGMAPESLKQLLPEAETDFVDMLINIFTENRVADQARSVFNFLNKYLDKDKSKNFLTLYLKKRKIDETAWQQLERLDPNSQLFEQLPDLFARDLNAAMAVDDAPPRVALLFDTHESFWGTDKHRESEESYFSRDEWLRRLLRALDLDAGIVAVVAGREAPRWSDAPIQTIIPEAYLDVWLIGHLSAEDADAYLIKASIKDSVLRNALIAMSEVASGQIHPLYIGLCGDIALAAARRGEKLNPADLTDPEKTEDKTRSLVTRLLRYCDTDLSYAVKTLAAARGFDRNLFFALGNAMHYQATVPFFQQLVQFSFVWPMPDRDEGWYRVHDLLRRALGALNETETMQAHAALETYYRDQHNQGNELAIVHAIYHANQQDWQRGFDEWNTLFGSAIEKSQHVLCENLQALQSEMKLESNFSRGTAAYQIGSYAISLSRHSQAMTALSEAIQYYNADLQAKPDYVFAHNNLGNTLAKLADLQANLSQHNEALENYQQSIESYRQALDRAPDDVSAHNNLGSTLLSLANLQANLSQHNEALENYQQSRESYRQALDRAPDYVFAHNNLGLALQSLADLQANLSQHNEALENYQQSRESYRQALNRAPDYVFAHNNLGNTLLSLANLQANLSQHNEALKNYQQSIESYRQALNRAPNHPVILKNHEVAEQKLSNFQGNNPDQN
ncbi:tetratricopeptide repeat protein [Nitrosomonas aestuarii]|uniref:tetratricopeptide repeat protein n=1 Tax=Nitrosomonas aestuarii TaxID=52441 RepID=UPI000D30A795|nr:tetratricopeptide repeat protein [Nitrosomonas aestuarii]PTN09982.1 tetratricopeptide repeat protein [Nitrosomonas aestuarii]